MSNFGRPPIKMGGYIFSAANFRSEESSEATNLVTDEPPIEGPDNKRKRMENELLVCKAEIKELKKVLEERDDEIAKLKLACLGQARVSGQGGSKKVDLLPKPSEQAAKIRDANAPKGFLEANKDKVQQQQPKPNDNQTTSV